MDQRINAQGITKQFGNCLNKSLQSSDDRSAALTALLTAFDEPPPAVDNETRKLLMDQGFRDCLTNGYLSSSSGGGDGGGGAKRAGFGLDLRKARFLVELSIQAAKSERCSVNLPIAIMADIFDVLYLDDAQEFFSIVEENAVYWKNPFFFATIKNNLLRICNDLLRRLSRTQDTVFCGRILLFLAKFFPFSERSGLNIISEFNLDNVTAYNTDSSAYDDDDSAAAAGGGTDSKMEVDDSKQVKIDKDSEDLNIDYALYVKFWQLQDYFRNPVQCYEKAKWASFSRFSTQVLETFKSFKVDSAVTGGGKAI